MASPDEILAYWFGSAPQTDPGRLSEQMKRWYQGGEPVGREIRERFGSDVERALAGDYDAWAANPRSRLALILLLDQFTRSVFPGTARAFAGDANAQRLAVEALDRGWPRSLFAEERLFYVMPLMHAESVELLERCISELRQLVADCPEALRPIYGVSVSQGEKYRDVIARFGRFPHRNQALGRTPTDAEQEFLKSWQRAPPDADAPSADAPK
jgi:uncharacterized protein (DUF924 family)